MSKRSYPFDENVSCHQLKTHVSSRQLNYHSNSAMQSVFGEYREVSSLNKNAFVILHASLKCWFGFEFQQFMLRNALRDLQNKNCLIKNTK